MCKLANVPRIGEDSYKNVKNFAHPASREIPGQARNEALVKPGMRQKRSALRQIGKMTRPDFCLQFYIIQCKPIFRTSHSEAEGRHGGV